MNYLQEIKLLKMTIFLISCFNISKFIFSFTYKIKDAGNISEYYKNINEKKKSLKRGRKFFYKCINDVSINQHYEKNHNNNPLVSVIIPAFNAEFKIKKAIRSIQNQYTSNFEIILVNDYSNDKTMDVIKEFQKDDDRIMLIENKENRGILYSRCIGTLMASGKYIFPLDNDDLFFDEGIISSIVKKAIKGKFDIVEFNYAEFSNPKIPPIKLLTSEFGNHSDNLILFQPELSQFPRKKNNVIIRNISKNDHG